MERGVEAVSVFLIRVSAAVIVLTVLMLVGNVIARAFFGATFNPTFELTRNAVALIAFLQLPNAIYRRSLIRVNFLYLRVGAGWQRAMDAFGYLVGVVIFAVLAAVTWKPMISAFVNREYEGGAVFYMPLGPIRVTAIVLWTVAALTCPALVMRALFRRHHRASDMPLDDAL